MLLGIGKFALSRRQATLTLRFTLPTLPSSTLNQLQCTPAAVLTGIRFKTTKAAEAAKASTSAKKTTAKKATETKKTTNAITAKKPATVQKAIKATRSSIAAKQLQKSTSRLAVNARTRAKEQSVAKKKVQSEAAKSRQEKDKARRAAEKEKKAIAAVKEKEKKALKALREKERKATILAKERQRKAEQLERAKLKAKERRETQLAKARAKREAQKVRKQSQRALARERAKLQREKLRAKMAAKKQKERDQKKKEKEKAESTSLRGILKTYLEPSLVNIAPPTAAAHTTLLGYGVFAKELVANKQFGSIKEAREKWAALSESEQQKYNEIGHKQNEDKQKAYTNWIMKIPGQDIITANAARAKIRNAYKKAGKKVPARFKPIRDPRQPKAPATAFVIFALQKGLMPDAGGKIGDKTKALGVEWQAMSDQQKAPFREEFLRHQAAYNKSLAQYVSKA